jgi:hypothetical protein
MPKENNKDAIAHSTLETNNGVLEMTEPRKDQTQMAKGKSQGISSNKLVCRRKESAELLDKPVSSLTKFQFEISM